MRRCLVGGVLACAAVVAVACGPFPGTSRCKVGNTERTIQCSQICREASEARSETEKDDIRECAEHDCDVQCE